LIVLSQFTDTYQINKTVGGFIRVINNLSRMFHKK
jgi:hypothetical protein